MGRPRKNTSQTGWRLPVPIIEALRAEAKRQGIRVGQLYEQILRRHLVNSRTGSTAGAVAARITTAAELAQRMPLEIEKRSAESDLAKTLREFES